MLATQGRSHKSVEANSAQLEEIIRMLWKHMLVNLLPTFVIKPHESIYTEKDTVRNLQNAPFVENLTKVYEI